MEPLTLSCEKIQAGNFEYSLEEYETEFLVRIRTVPAPAVKYVTVPNDTAIFNNSGIYNITTTTASSGWSSYYSTDRRVALYRLFFVNGFLRCEEYSVPHTYVVSMKDPYAEIPKEECGISLIHPIEFVSKIFDSSIELTLKLKVYALANRMRIKIPEKFIVTKTSSNALPDYPNSDVFIYDTTTATNVTYSSSTNDYSKIDPAIAWLSYPLIRELDSVAVINSANRFSNRLAFKTFVAPNIYTAMNFKELVTNFYGTYTEKMLKEIWKVITVGNEYRTVVAQTKELVELRNSINQENVTIVSYTQNDVGQACQMELGDRKFNTAVFTLAPAIFKTMGFDYLYKFLSLIPGSYFYNTEAAQMVHNSDECTKKLECILKYVTPQKMFSLIIDLDFNRYIDDLRNMLTSYDSPEKIPKSLRTQFPNGIEVDFNFKTMKELHDKISAKFTLIKAEEAKKEIPVHSIYAKLHGREKNGLKLVVPTNTSFLALWGAKLSICIASYGDKAAKGYALLLGVEKDGEIKYCLEFNCAHEKEEDLPLFHVGSFDSTNFHFKTVQFRGLKNSDPSPEDKANVDDLLSEFFRENEEFFKNVTMIDKKEICTVNNNFIANNGIYRGPEGWVPGALYANAHEVDALRYIQIGQEANGNQNG